MPNLGTALIHAITIVFALLVPLAILGGRFAIKSQRQGFFKYLLGMLKDTTGKDVSLIQYFDHALRKYNIANNDRRTSFWREFWYYAITDAIFVVIDWSGFYVTFNLASRPILPLDIFMFSGFNNNISSESYRRISGRVLAFAFLGAYSSSIKYQSRI